MAGCFLFKESVNFLSDSVFETISSFSNRYGGYILLGVKEVKRGNKKVGEVIGVNPKNPIIAKFFVNIGYADLLYKKDS